MKRGLMRAEVQARNARGNGRRSRQNRYSRSKQVIRGGESDSVEGITKSERDEFPALSDGFALMKRFSFSG
jgi:hypothetical protein